MKSMKPFTFRRVRAQKHWAYVTTAAMIMSSISGLVVPSVVKAQTAPVGNGFVLDSGDLKFIYEQILVAQDHAAGGELLGPGPNQVLDPQLPRGLRTVDGSFNNLVPGQVDVNGVPSQFFGAADRKFPRLAAPLFRSAESLPFDPDGAGPQTAGQPTSYTQKTGFVADSQPRLASNLIVDQTANNPAALEAALNPCGEGGFVCSAPSLAEVTDPVTKTLFIPNITPDFGLSAPFNLMFTFFGQFFDHGLDLVNKGGGVVIMPLKADDPLIVGADGIAGTADDPPNPPPANQRFMVIDRATNLPGPDGILGTADDEQNGINQTTPWVDQNQTYTSHPSHQVFLRMYALVGGRPQQTGKVLDGDHCAPRGTGFPGDDICNIGNWTRVKAQAATILGIRLTDADVTNAPLILTDPYGHFKPGPARGMPQLVLPGNVLVEGNTAGGGIAIPANAFRTGHAFLNDIAHSAVPVFTAAGVLKPDADATAGSSLDTPVCPVGVTAPCYDDELLGLHFATGDGRGNENIALTTMHTLFHAEHNRLVANIDNLINQPVGPSGVNATGLTAAQIAAWHAVHAPSGWDYNERLFQAARFVTEMEYQHLVFEEFARKIQPLINPFLGGITSINGAITAEFAHTVYRLGHSMLPEVVARVNVDAAGVEVPTDIRLFNAFLNPQAFNNAGAAFPNLTAAQAAGSIVRGMSRTIGNELDEFVTDSVRNTLVGLPLDLPAINMARGRSEGIPPLNNARTQFFNQTHDTAVKPYANWFEFGLSLKHQLSLGNFIGAYGKGPDCTPRNLDGTLAVGLNDRRAAGARLAVPGTACVSAPASVSGLNDVDFWVGGLAERQAVFGGLLGSTFNFVFEHQLEFLQDGDRFYYLQRTDGINLRFQLEGNSLAELAKRNTDAGNLMDIVFNTADFIFNLSDPQFAGTAPVDSGDGTTIFTLADGTKLFFDPDHRGKNIVFNGTGANDRMQADIGDDTILGNAGDDRLTGGEGNDTLIGGVGDDVMFGDNGDDILKGGPGNDAMQGGPGFGGDLLIGAEGKDFMVGGNDGVEYFGGPGDDMILDGTTRSEGMFGGDGDDWIEAGDGHDGGLFGDGGNVFDLLAGLDRVGGDDVEDGGPGQDGHFGEGGDDIFLQSEGSNKFFGDYGFDWVTQRAWPFPADIELSLLALPNAPINFNDLRNKYRFVDGASGWNFNDSIRGSNSTLCAPPGAIAECLVAATATEPGMELTAAGAAKIGAAPGAGQVSLTQLMGPAGFNKNLNDPAIPGIKGVGFMGGDILLGGAGSDVLEGKLGDDLIDGDRWLNVQLKYRLNGETVDRFADHLTELQDFVFADPQQLNPGNISIVKTIVTPPAVAPDCGSANPQNCDTAMFNFPLQDYDVTTIPFGVGQRRVIVTNVPAPVVAPAIARPDEGTDTLLNIERLQFSDGTIAVPNTVNRTVPSIVGLDLATATAVLLNAGLSVGVVGAVNSDTVPIDLTVSQRPTAGSLLVQGGRVSFDLSLGPLAPVSVPLVTGLTFAGASQIITLQGLVVGATTSASSNTVPAGSVVSQNPIAGAIVAAGSAVALVVSTGPALVAVPNVVGLTQAAATTAITGAGLVLGPVTTASSPTVPSGSVVSSNPAAGIAVLPGSPVAIVVSTGPAAVAGLIAAFGFEEASGTTVIDSSATPINGTLGGGTTAPTRVLTGKFGRAMSFDGGDNINVPDGAATKLDLTNGMTIEAWVNPSSMNGWESVAYKDRGAAGTGLLSYALYAHDGGASTPPAGYVRTSAGGPDRGIQGGTARLPLNTWSHIAVTYTTAVGGSTLRFYVNGALVNTVTGPNQNIVAGNQPLRIGNSNAVISEGFNGLIDEIRIYNRALSLTEIGSDMSTPIVP
jgi:beta-lactam-binding protein with PASTA domain/Ca2+-binding RTX toxin-like protein